MDSVFWICALWNIAAPSDLLNRYSSGSRIKKGEGGNDPELLLKEKIKILC